MVGVIRALRATVSGKVPGGIHRATRQRDDKTDNGRDERVAGSPLPIERRNTDRSIQSLGQLIVDDTAFPPVLDYIRHHPMLLPG